MGQIQIQEITDLQQLDSIHDQWSALWASSTDASPFQSPDWLIPWWRLFGHGQLWTIAVREDQRLIGIAPLFIQGDEPGQRTVQFIGVGISDYLDVLAEPGCENIVTTSLFQVIEQSETWDELHFQELSTSSPLLDWELRPIWQSAVSVQEVCPVLQLPQRGQPPSSTIPPRMLEKLRYYRRRASREGCLTARRADPDNFRELFDAFLKLHAKRWNSRGTDGVLADPKMLDFHRSAASRFALSNILRLYTIELDDNIIASLYGFSHGFRTFHYLSGFDPQYAALSPGTLVIGHAIEQAIIEGCREFDFLRGRETYKYMWGAKARLNLRRRIVRPSALHSREPAYYETATA